MLYPEETMSRTSAAQGLALQADLTLAPLARWRHGQISNMRYSVTSRHTAAAVPDDPSG